MTEGPHPGPTWSVPPAPSLTWPPIDRLPLLAAPQTSRPAPSEPEAFASFVESTSSWEHGPGPIPPAATFALWVLGVANLLIGGWTAAVLLGSVSCSGFVCSIILLGNRPALLLTLAACCVLTLAAAAFSSSGLTRAGGVQLGLLALATVTGAGALLGLVVSMLAVVVTTFVLGGIAVALVDR